MIEITVDPKAQNPKAEASRHIIEQGKALSEGAEVEILFSGGLIGHVKVTRMGANTPDDTLILSGELAGQKMRRYPVPLRWAGAMPAQNTYAPDARLMQETGRSTPTVADLYAGGCRFSSEGCPRAKPGREPSPEAVQLAKDVSKGLREWSRDLMVRAGFDPEDPKARKRWLATLSPADRKLFTLRGEKVDVLEAA